MSPSLKKNNFKLHVAFGLSFACVSKLHFCSFSFSFGIIWDNEMVGIYRYFFYPFALSTGVIKIKSPAFL